MFPTTRVHGRDSISTALKDGSSIKSRLSGVELVSRRPVSPRYARFLQILSQSDMGFSASTESTPPCSSSNFTMMPPARKKTIRPQLFSYPVQRIYFHNPLTKTFKLLPKNSLISKVDYRDESYESVFGFGYNPSAQDYTVVSVDYVKISKQEEKTNAYVYTLKSNTWKRANNLPVHRFGTRFPGGVLAGGRLHRHWLRDDKLGIVSFDLADNFFGEVLMDLPTIVRNSIYMLSRLHIAVLGGCLSLVVDEGFQIVIWGMRVYGVKESWESMYTLGWLFYEEYTFVEGSNSIRVLGLRKNGDILLAIDSVGLVSYNPRHGAVGLVFKGDGFEAAEDCVRVSDLITPSALCF
ncbi:F-box protein [Striga hermonthica]|uniref:F-box protein n=1 Tax=Striga hermonthica TaxID=68872 RepID=A0A9N7MTD6_STRHE|nr:F-box protein [Striga hermonthica]